MKDFVNKLKTLDYKQFALQHGEKIGIGVIGLLVLACLGMTNWAAEFTKSPRDMEEQAAKVDGDLKKNVWPEAERDKFIPPLTAEEQLPLVLANLEVGKFDWPKPLSQKLHQQQQPADEAQVATVIELMAKGDQAPIGIPVEVPATEMEDAEQPRPEARPGRSKSKKGAADDSPLPPRGAMPGMAAGYMSGGGSTSSGEKARGMRFVVVTGVVDVQKQYGMLMNSLHVGSKPEAAAELEYLDFKIQRQRAVPGPSPWTGDWVDVAKENSIDILLNETSDFDPEIVPTANTEQVITSPLPRRVDDEWNPTLVAHPRVPTLSEEEQELELKKNKASLEAAGDEDDESAGTRRGFAKVQRDAKRLQSRVMGGGSEMTSKFQDAMSRMMGGQTGGAPMDMMKMSMNMNRGMMNGPGIGMANTSVDMTTDYLLFRFFDFDVEPGECYRYRVQLVIRNPSYGESFVSSPAVAEGETRESKWSEPSTPAVVARDVEYALTKVPTSGNRDQAELNVVQFDNDNGTFLKDSFKVPFGSYIAKAMKSLHLDMAAPKFEEEEVKFTSKDVLLDCAAAPALSSDLKTDLGLADKALRELSRGGKLDMAVTLNRFGEIVELDAGSRDALQPALKRVEEEREPYKELKDAGKKKDQDLLTAADPYGADKDSKDKKKKKKKKKRDKADNALKMPGSMGSMMMAPGGMMPPGSIGAPSGGKKGKQPR